MKQRSPITSLLLALFVPFYIWYWLYVTAQVFRKRNVPSVPTLALIVVPNVLLFTAVAVFDVILFARLGGSSTGLSSRQLSFALLAYAISYVCFMVCACIYYYNFSKAAERLAGSDLSAGIMTLIFVLFAPLPVYFIQERLNHLAYTAASSPAAPLPPNPVA